MTSTTRRRAEHTGTAALFALLMMPVGSAWAFDLSLPAGAQRSFHTVQDPGAYDLPVAPWAGDALPTLRVEGRIEVDTWRIPESSRTAFQLIQPLRDALADQGYDIVLDCDARTCGGFDFRFATLVLPAPAMFVSLDAYRFVAAQAPDGGAVSVLASQGPRDGYVQIIRAAAAAEATITPDAARAPPVSQSPVSQSPVAPLEPGDLPAALQAQGHVVLSDLVFSPGSSQLGEETVASLDALAAYLAAHPTQRLLFVGHTDATGSLEANRRVSLDRAQAAMGYLRRRHDTDPDQMGAEGVGYLSPVATNLTKAGREANRRVEAVLIPPD